MALSDDAGRVVRIAGPVVHLAGVPGGTRFEFVEVGERRLPGEIISIDHELVVAQLYEYSGGLEVGEPARRAGRPFTVALGPDLLGGIHDGLLRPLQDGETFLEPRPIERRSGAGHRFEPLVEPGTQVRSGQALGRVPTGGSIDHLVLVPPGLAGTVDDLVGPGDVRSDATIAHVDGVPVSMTSEWPIRRPRPHAGRDHERTPFRTGQRVLDLLAPIACGSTATVIGGFGEGKTMLLEQVAKWGDADVIVYVGCGERGNELTDLIAELAGLTDPRTGRSLMERTVVLANTSNMPVMAREASIYTAVTVAEYYRDMGLHAVIIADSTSRWAEAQRELASRTGAIPAEEGYPADLAASLAAFYQRAGRVRTLGGQVGTVTIVTSVSPPGGDVTEPVSAHTQRFVQAVWALDRELAYARHYPAVSWRRSFSRDVEAVAGHRATHGDPDWASRRARLQVVLSEADRLQGIADLVGSTALPSDERMTLLVGRLIREAVLQQSALSPNDASCAPAKQAALADAVLAVHDRAQDLARAGVPASLVEELDFGPLLRAKDTTAADDDAGVAAIVVDLLRSMEELAP